MENKPLPLKIAGVGRYLPVRVVTSRDLEERHGLPNGWCERELGIEERRWVEKETISFMGAEAAREAIDSANTDIFDIDLILCASIGFERIIPDDAPLVQRQLGLGDSGIPALTLKNNCLGFLTSLDMSACLLAAGCCRNILIISSEIMSHNLDFSNPRVGALFGDGAAAAVVTLPGREEGSGIHEALFETYSNNAPLFQSLIGTSMAQNKYLSPRDLALQVKTEAFYQVGNKYMRSLMKKLCGICGGQDTKNLRLVIPQQAGRYSLEFLEKTIPGHKIIRVFQHFGFCGAASIPMALYQAVKEEKLVRDDLFLMAGCGAGLSVGGMVITY